MGNIIELNQGLTTAFVDSTNPSNVAYKPQFLSNNYKEGSKVLSSIEDELLSCDEFAFSVAFINMHGIAPLLQTLKKLEEHNIRGRILTTDYLHFTEPKALRKLAEFKNITLKIYFTEEAPEGFHTKGYIFKNEEIYRIITGSSNLTASALTRNREWNTKIVSTKNGEYAKDILEEFEKLWVSEHSWDYEEVIDRYETSYRIVKEQRKIAKNAEIPSIEAYRLQPNSMQIGFIENLKKIREKGEERALLISATGTGKTYASAFALREENPKKALFLIHREQVAKKAIESYKKVFGKIKKFALLSGSSKDFEELKRADYVFSTMQMMAKAENYEKFSKDEFDTIIIDEVHRAGAESYQRIMAYFQPKFWLGMTASPDRTDGYDIYQLFDHNIAYEIRLQKALEEDLLCPFHYFGITDLEINGEVFDDTAGLHNFKNLVCDARVDYVIEKAEFYGHGGERVKGLIFCSRKEEGKELSEKFNQRGYRTMFLSGDTTQEAREVAIERLEQEETENGLDYIFTVDIFNEGIDIPQVNQVIMLRPTESPIVFVQQLGRGLRKAENKEYVVILDFIGNYTNNFMIPIALSGDKTYNKDNIRRYVREGTRVIPGSSTIHFDEVSKKRIFQSIDKMETKSRLLKEKYQQLKNKLGRIPTILDFYQYGEIDPMLFISYSKTYDNFVRKFDSDYKISFTQAEEAMLEFVSSLLVNGKRPHELLMLQMLLDNKELSEESFETELCLLGEKYRKSDYLSSVSVLSKQFINTQSERVKFETVEFLNKDVDEFKSSRRALTFYQKIQRKEFMKELTNLIVYGLKKYNDNYKNHDEDNLVLYEKYSRKDVCRILNWERDDSSTMYGYRIKYNTCPIFVTYEKKDDIASSTKYEDQFINEQIFSWMTRSKVSIGSPESQAIINYKESGLKIYLFVKKSDGEGTDFYYMGKVEPIKWSETTIMNDKGKELPIMNFQMKLEHSVRSDIYEYFTK